jgi:hypothetical protein
MGATFFKAAEAVTKNWIKLKIEPLLSNIARPNW